MLNNKDIAALECDLLGKSSTFKYFRAANCELQLRARKVTNRGQSGKQHCQKHQEIIKDG